MLLYFLIVLLIFIPTEQRAAPLSVEAALEVGAVPTFPHDDEQPIAPYPDHAVSHTELVQCSEHG